MTNEHERTLKMKREYITLFNAGLSPREIARKFNLSESTVYNSLQEIADVNGVIGGRNALLAQPRDYPEVSKRSYTHVDPIDMEVLLHSTRETVAKFRAISAKLDAFLKEAEAQLAQEEEEKRKEEKA